MQYKKTGHGRGTGSYEVKSQKGWKEKKGKAEETHAILSSDRTLADVFRSPSQLLKHRVQHRSESDRILTY